MAKHGSEQTTSYRLLRLLNITIYCRKLLCYNNFNLFCPHFFERHRSLNKSTTNIYNSCLLYCSKNFLFIIFKFDVSYVKRGGDKKIQIEWVSQKSPNTNMHTSKINSYFYQSFKLYDMPINVC